MPEPTVLAAPPVPRAPRLHESRFKLAEGARNVWEAKPEAGTSYEAVLDRNYWINIARYMRVRDFIDVVPEDNSWYAKLIVLYVDTPEMPRAVDVAAAAPLHMIVCQSKPLSADYDIEWRGPNGKFTLVAKATKAVLQGKFESKELAAAWLEDHLKKAA